MNGNDNASYVDPVCPTFNIQILQNGNTDKTSVTFHNISYVVNSRGLLRRKAESKTILHKMSGLMEPGLNAIMGPTGSGKSSLLDVLAGRKEPVGLSGNVFVNGKPQPKNFKCLSGYVVQQDIVVGTLTVRENLWFSANLRLPRDLSDKVKKQRLDEILSELGLTTCADTKVGNEMIRGISGGEKKRASIAMELITAPTVLFLDEPTTGLDASTANAVMLLLKRLSQNGRTVILSIHQPRYNIFRHFDTLTLLTRGQLTFHGPTHKVLPFFEKMGYHCERHNNPADFILDVVNRDSTMSSQLVEMKNQAEESTLSEQIVSAYKKSEACKVIERKLLAIAKEQSGMQPFVCGKEKTFTNSFFYQFVKLCSRNFRNISRNPSALITSIIINIVSGIVFGLLYYNVDSTPNAGTQNRLGLIFFVLTKIMFDALASVDTFIKERKLFTHEHISGYYYIISYFLAKLAADIIPLNTFGVVIGGSISYWMGGLKLDASAFFTFLLFCLATSYSSVSFALFFSASCENSSVATLILNLIFVFSLMFNNLLINLNSIFPWLVWIKYLSISHYSFTGASINEFLDLNFTCAGVAENSSCRPLAGEQYLHERFSIGYSPNSISNWDLWQNLVALACMTLGVLALAFIQLMRIKMLT